MSLVQHVVVDSGGFIRNAPIRDIGLFVYTIREVVDEIRDKATRQRLQVLPYELKFKEPSSDSIRLVTEFSKKTGDYKNLSAVDIRVLALVYEIEKENCGIDHIKTVPDKKISWHSTQKHTDNVSEMAGFYIGKKNTSTYTNVTLDDTGKDCTITEQVENTVVKNKATEKDNVTKSENIENTTTNFENVVTTKENENNILVNETVKENEILNRETVTTPNENTTIDIEIELLRNKQDNSKDMPIDCLNSKEGCIEGDVLPESCLEQGCSEDESEENSEESDDDDDGWITPSNIKQMKQKMGDANTEKADVKVGCITTDFAMQNVLLQMGLNVISVDGLLIKRAKNYVQRCYGCFKISTDMTREFCHHCGNRTLQRVSMTVEDDGSIKYFLSSRKPLSTRGKKFSLPMPKGGKHASNPILCEDQREAQQRTTKAFRVKYDVFDPDYVAHNSPFAPVDTHSRAAQLGIKGKKGHKSRKNPNENRKVYGRRK